MWLVVYFGHVYNNLKTVDEVVDLIFTLTNKWRFCSYLREYLMYQDVDFEEDFEDECVYIFRYR